jgi:hypothetical protein
MVGKLIVNIATVVPISCCNRIPRGLTLFLYRKSRGSGNNPYPLYANNMQGLEIFAKCLERIGSTKFACLQNLFWIFNRKFAIDYKSG